HVLGRGPQQGRRSSSDADRPYHPLRGDATDRAGWEKAPAPSRGMGALQGEFVICDSLALPGAVNCVVAGLRPAGRGGAPSPHRGYGPCAICKGWGVWSLWRRMAFRVGISAMASAWIT